MTAPAFDRSCRKIGVIPVYPPSLYRARPTIEHFRPLLYTLAVADDAEELSSFNQDIDLGSIWVEHAIGLRP
jgi:hypothetical protein